MERPHFPITALPLWQKFNGITLAGVHVANSAAGKGYGLLADRDLKATESDNGQNSLLKCPNNLVLTAEKVEEYAKQSTNFKLLLDAAGRQSPRGDILLFLLVQLVIGCRDESKEPVSARCPWTEYVKCLPDEVPVPTMWTKAERALLEGTSLEIPVGAKVIALEREFDRLQELSSDIPAWQEAFWISSAPPQLEDWVRVDAWYRSRCLDLPQSGEAMVPCIDMVNHSTTPNARYEELDHDSVVLLLRPGQEVKAGEEITITYSGDVEQVEAEGEDNMVDHRKSAAEMLFSYGFIDPASARQRVVLPFRTFPDDPLAKAKLHVFGSHSPVLEIERIIGADAAATATPKTLNDAHLRWSCPFAHLMCVNQEDGLGFLVRQQTDGETQLRAFWQDVDVTEKVVDFEALTKTHPLAAVFQLRVLTVVCEQLQEQLGQMQEPVKPETQRVVRGEISRQVGCLRDLETDILSFALEKLEAERSDLFTDETVVAYLGSMEVAESTLAAEEAPNQHKADTTAGAEDDTVDFS